MTRRGRIPLVIAVVAAVIAVAIGMREPRDPLERLALAARELPARPTEARLHGFPFAQPPPTAVATGLPASMIRLRRTAGEILQSRGHDDHAAGVAALLAGAPDDAVRRLTACSAGHPADASVWNDLAAARYTTAVLGDRPQELLTALAAADHSLRLARLPEAIFNRGLILEALGLNAAASKQYDRYRSIDPASPWSAEASKRTATLRVPTAADDWQKALPRLKDAAARGDGNAVQAIVKAFPQEARTWGETLFLRDWAIAARAGDRVNAATRLASVAAVAAALQATNGERLLSDTTAALRALEAGATVSVANAQLQYVEGRELYGARNVADALPLFQQSAKSFEAFHIPMGLVACYYAACALYDHGDSQSALDLIDRVTKETPTAYPALHAELLWESGQALIARNRYYEALEAQNRATAIFGSLGEKDNTATTESQAIATAAVLGRGAEVWRGRRSVFHRASRAGNALLLQRSIDVAARTEALASHWDNAYSLFTLVIEKELRANPRIYVNSLIWAGLTADKLGLTRQASNHLQNARAALSSIQDPVLAKRASAELLLATAFVTVSRSPRAAAGMLSTYIEPQMRDDNTFLVPEALLARAHARNALGDANAAISDLRSALDLLSVRGESVPVADFRDAFFRTRETAARDLTNLLQRQGDGPGALAVIDTTRGSAFPGNFVRTQSSLSPVPPNAAVIEYVSYPDHLLIFIRNSQGTRVQSINTSAEELHKVCDDGSIRPDGDLRPCAKAILWSIEGSLGAANRLVIIPDSALARVPFAALPTSGGTLLVQSAEITIAPSMSVGLMRVAAVDARRITLIADPAFDERRFADLPRLRGAQREAATIATLYPHPVVFTGAAATPDRVMTALRDSSIIEIAAHAVTTAGDPFRSHFVLAPAGTDSGVLFLSDIAGQVVHQAPLVILTACASAAPTTETTTVPNLAAAFLAAGASNVVGTLTAIDDDLASEIAIALHRQLRSGTRPSAALRAVQLACMTSPTQRLRLQSVWGAYQVYGSGVQGSETRTPVRQ
jgi:tetratricopeptide (TPR) repeat protein